MESFLTTISFSFCCFASKAALALPGLPLNLARNRLRAAEHGRSASALIVRPVLSVNPARGSRIQDEANAADVADHERIICSVDPATQPAHLNIDKVGFRSKFMVPYLFQEGRPGQHFVTPLHHVFEQLKFARPQIDVTVATLRSPIDEIELQWSHAQHRFFQRSQQPGQRVAD